jgi:hypothetical protein
MVSSGDTAMPLLFEILQIVFYHLSRKMLEAKFPQSKSVSVADIAQQLIKTFTV